MKNSESPPKWMDNFMSFYCNEHLLEDLQGDLHEFYNRNIADKGRFMARLIYFLDVLKFIRFYTVKTPKLLRQMNYLAIFNNSFKTSIRSILRNKLFSAINVTGLSISMSVGLLVISLYMELNQFDRFHKEADRIYRIINTVTDDDGTKTFASSSILAGEKIRDEFTGVEKVVITVNGFSIDAHYDDKIVPVRGKYANPEFFEVFDFEGISGNLLEALKEPNSLILSKDAAEKIFGDKSGLNQVISDGQENNYTVKAIIENFPKNSHLSIEAICSIKTIEDKKKDETWFKAWNNMWSNHVYVLLNKDYELSDFQSQLDKLSERQNKLMKSSITMHTIPLTGIVPGPSMSNMAGPGFDIDVLYILAGLALIILISACFNYTNLSVARSLRRSKEVGIRKTVGASRGQVFFQFVLEATIVSLVALIISIGLFFLLRPYFLEALGYQGRIVDLYLTPSIVVVFIAFAFLSGIVAGFFPSYVLSGMQVKSIFKDVSSIKLFSNISLRKTLIVFQFSLSMIFIMSTLIGFKQYSYMLNFNLGYSTENILNVSISGNNYKLLETEFRKIPQVKDVSFSLMIPSVGSMYLEQAKDPLTQDSLEIAYNKVHPNYLKLHDHEIIAGSDFDDSYINSKDKIGIIVNKKFLEYFRIESPEDAIGRKFDISQRKATVIGVMNDFHFGTTEDELAPFLFMNGKGDGTEKWPDYYQANLKLEKGDVREAITQIEAAWKRVDNVHQFSAKFYSEEIERTYSFFKSLINILGVLAVIAISIATLGLLGMVVFTTETRIKEISIRKILGATESNLLVLLGKNFLILLCLAAIIAIPLTFYAFNEYILQDYIYRPKIGFLELGGGTLLILLIGLIIVFSQTLIAARTNPSKTLRSE